MPVVVKPVESGFAGEISGVDLSRLLSEADHSSIVAAIDRHAVVVFRGQKLGDELPATLVFERAGRIKVVFKVETGVAPPRPGPDR